MSSNRYSHRKSSLPKPAVCKKKKRAYYLNAVLFLNSLAPFPPNPPSENLVLHNLRLGGNLFQNKPPSSLFAATAVATYHPSDRTWELWVQFTTQPPYGSGITFTRSGKNLKAVPFPAGIVTLNFSRIDPDFETGYLKVTIPEFLP